VVAGGRVRHQVRNGRKGLAALQALEAVALRRQVEQNA
jgi:hypothetical protein